MSVVRLLEREALGMGNEEPPIQGVPRSLKVRPGTLATWFLARSAALHSVSLHEEVELIGEQGQSFLPLSSFQATGTLLQ